MCFLEVDIRYLIFNNLNRISCFAIATKEVDTKLGNWYLVTHNKQLLNTDYYIPKHVDTFMYMEIGI